MTTKVLTKTKVTTVVLLVAGGLGLLMAAAIGINYAQKKSVNIAGTYNIKTATSTMEIQVFEKGKLASDVTVNSPFAGTLTLKADGSGKLLRAFLDSEVASATTTVTGIKWSLDNQNKFEAYYSKKQQAKVDKASLFFCPGVVDPKNIAGCGTGGFYMSGKVGKNLVNGIMIETFMLGDKKQSAFEIIGRANFTAEKITIANQVNEKQVSENEDMFNTWPWPAAFIDKAQSLLK